MQINKYKYIFEYIYIIYYIQYISFLWNLTQFLQECSYSGGFQSHFFFSGFWSHSSGFLWIPVEFGHSCRNVRGIEKYWSLKNITTLLTSSVRLKQKRQPCTGLMISKLIQKELLLCKTQRGRIFDPGFCQKMKDFWTFFEVFLTLFG